MAALTPLSPTDTTDCPSCVLVARGLRQPVTQLCGALSCCPAACHQCWALHRVILHCGTARPALSLQVVMEVPESLVHIHRFVLEIPTPAIPAAVQQDWHSEYTQLGGCGAQPGTRLGMMLLGDPSQAQGWEAGQCARPVLVATHEAEQAAKGRPLPSAPAPVLSGGVCSIPVSLGGRRVECGPGKAG